MINEFSGLYPFVFAHVLKVNQDTWLAVGVCLMALTRLLGVPFILKLVCCFGTGNYCLLGMLKRIGFGCCDSSVHTKGWRWSAGDMSPPGRSRQSDSGVSAPVFCAYAHFCCFGVALIYGISSSYSLVTSARFLWFSCSRRRNATARSLRLLCLCSFARQAAC